jgi:hypothetical protein
MKIAACCGLALLGFIAAANAAPEKSVRIELNAAETIQNKCRLSFVIENKSDEAVESLKLDLVVFGKDGGIQRRLVTEMAPLRPTKTIVKAFDIDGDCAPIGSILVNDVTACAPGPAAACLDRLVLASRLPNVRLFK